MQSALLPRRLASACLVALAVLLSGGGSASSSTSSAQSANGYLARFGPPVLRFAAPVSDLKRFHGAFPLVSAAMATNEGGLTGGGVGTRTNAPAHDFTLQTNVLVEARSPLSLPAEAVQEFGASASAQGSASNLLLFTPQMLAEFFKASLDVNSRSSTNLFPSTEMPFVPPSPKVPLSSEATYRSQ